MPRGRLLIHPPESTSHLQVRIPTELHDELQDEARAERLSLNAISLQILKDGLIAHRHERLAAERRREEELAEMREMAQAHANRRSGALVNV